MPATPLVPSKGALRALRNLALGTSCTMAFGAGMITEDRRRRIRSAREINDNAQKIKSSRNYYSTGKASIHTVDDQVADESIWLAGDPTLRKLTKDTNGALKKQETELSMPRELPPPSPITKYDSSELLNPEVRIPINKRWELAVSSAASSVNKPIPMFAGEWKEKKPPKPIPADPTPVSSETLQYPTDSPPPLELPGPTRSEITNRQHRLANDVCKLLDTQDDLENVQAAALRFLDAFEEGIVIGDRGIVSSLIESAARLSEACRRYSELTYAERVLDVILDHATHIDEDTFARFAPLEVISNLILRKGPTSHVPLPECKLRKAAAVYLMEFKQKPKPPINPALHWDLGQKLCRETCLAGLYELTQDLYFRLQQSRRGLPPLAVDHLITATHAWGRHKRVLRYFKTFYSQTSPHKVELYTISDQVIDSVIETGKMEQAEEVLFIADQLAAAGGFASSTTPILKVIGHQFRATRDMSKIKELFQRLEPLAHKANHPQAVYGAIIQCCIESGEENTAKSYYASFRANHTPDQADLRIYGHFVLAKAMRNDWAGVLEDLQNMALLITSKNQGDYERVFVPIFSLFAKSHSVGETEEFVQNFIDQHQLKLTDRILNVMINVYARANEVDSLFRWIDYATSVGCPIGAVSVNSILNHCHSQWNMPFWHVLKLYSKIRTMEGHSQKFTDQNTLEILGRLALADRPSEVRINRGLKRLKRLNRSKQLWDAQGVIRAMAIAFKKNNFAATLKIYTLALEKGVLLQSSHVQMAVRASLALHGADFSEAVRLIRDAQRRNQSADRAVANLIMHQLDVHEDSRTEVDQRLQFAEAAISSLEDNGIQISQSILVHTMSNIEKAGQSRRALGFWNAMCRRLKIPTSEIVLESLNTLLKIYIKLQDGPGVQWVVGVLSANGIPPDKRFHEYVQRGRKYALKAREAGCANYPFMRAMQDALLRTCVLRKQHIEEQDRVKKMTIEIIESAIMDQERGGRIAFDKQSEGSASREVDDWETDEPWMEPDEELSAALRGEPPSNLLEVTAA